MSGHLFVGYWCEVRQPRRSPKFFRLFETSGYGDLIPATGGYEVGPGDYTFTLYHDGHEQCQMTMRLRAKESTVACMRTNGASMGIAVVRASCAEYKQRLRQMVDADV